MMPAVDPKSLVLRILRFCDSSKVTVRKGIHTTLFDASTISLKTINNNLDFVTQTSRWLTNAIIQTPFTDGIGSNVK